MDLGELGFELRGLLPGFGIREAELAQREVLGAERRVLPEQRAGIRGGLPLLRSVGRREPGVGDHRFVHERRSSFNRLDCPSD
jgi:hypothetical protein